MAESNGEQPAEREEGAALQPLDPAIPRALGEVAAYPHDPSAREGVRSIQTHVSHVFLTGERVYKLHKAVDLGFLRFATRDERNADCLREVELNRRLAAEVYLGVAPIERDADGVHVGALGESLAAAPSGEDVREHCVVMRRLPDGQDALSLLEEGRLAPTDVDRIAERIARFHREHRLGTPAPFSETDWFERMTGPAARNFESLSLAASIVPRDEVDAGRAEAEAAARRLAERFEVRRRRGRAVEGHGDLHLQHIFLELGPAEPMIIDCITFNDDLRRIDAAAEVAFPAMDLAYRGAAGLGARLLRRYAALTDDFDLYGVVDFFISYRAGVRAKVAALAALEPTIGAAQREAAAASARRHLALAREALAPAQAAPIVLVGGAVGTGKSSVAETFAERYGGVVVSSDRTRKHQLGIDPSDRRHAGEQGDTYSEAARARVYAGLLDRAEPIVRSGRVAILDATYGDRAHRDAARARAKALGVPIVFVESCCEPGEVLRRVAAREVRGLDASDAGPDVAALSRASFEPIREWPADARLTVRTDGPGWRERSWPVPLALASFVRPEY